MSATSASAEALLLSSLLVGFNRRLGRAIALSLESIGSRRDRPT
ncbi:hypothetical protein [Rubidibacter lacunae]|nr:hypothetical protein [Rubidibacter lacunae]